MTEAVPPVSLPVCGNGHAMDPSDARCRSCAARLRMQWMNASEQRYAQLGSPEEVRPSLPTVRERTVRIDRIERGDAVRHRDPRRYQVWIGSAVLGAMSLIAVPQVFDAFPTDLPDAVALRIIGAGTLLICVFGIWWSWRVGNIYLGRRGVRENGLYGPHSWTWAELDRASVEVLIPPMKAIKCRTLTLHLKNGKSHLAWCTLANPKDGEASWVDAVAREINEQIANRRS